MCRTFKIFLMILGLGVFILPKQAVFAQKIEQACTHKSGKMDCCKSGASESCPPTKTSDKNTCGDDCLNCHSCTVHCVTNFLSAEYKSTLLPTHFFLKKLNFKYGIPYFTSTIQNIWQPPKLG